MPSIMPAFSYQIGGSLGVKAPCYVVRKADEELYAGLQAGLFCYVLNSRQMGKSSLRVQTMHRLHQDGWACGVIDITAIGSQEITSEQWYASILSSLVSSFQLDVNLRVWWQEHLYLSPIKRLSKFVEDILLLETSQNIVIFIDEIDSVLGLSFSVDDFFAWIRSCYNKRTDQPAYQRITFALLGVATPADLIADKNRTPFNIGKAISLHGFALAETQPLAAGLQHKFDRPQQVLTEILDWTNGQPFLTQKICQILLAEPQPQTFTNDWLNQVIQQRVIHNWGGQDEPEHLKTIRDRILRNEKQLNRLLGIYGQILDQGEIVYDESSEQMELLLSGLVTKQSIDHQNTTPVLRISNRIYAAIFSKSWLEQELVKLRPYRESIKGWLVANEQDDSRLLRGSVLQEALAWSNHQKLGDDDYRFLNASQALESQNFRLVNAQRWSQLWKWLLVVALLAVVLLTGLTSWSLSNARHATLSEITALNSVSENFYKSNPQPLSALIPSLRAGNRLSHMLQTPEDLQAKVQNSLQKNLLAIKERNLFQGHTAPAMGANFSPDSQTIASASWDGTIKLWNTTGQALTTIPAHTAELWNVIFSPDGQLLASASSDQTVKLWSKTGQALHTLSGHTGVVGEVAFSPNSQYLASAGADGLIKIWNTQGQEINSFPGHTGWIWGLSFSPDGQTIASGGADKLIKLWSLDGKQLQTIAGHQDTVTEVIFSADGQHLASASNDGTVKLWSLTGQELQTFHGSGAQLWDLHFSPDGQTLAAVSSDSTIRFWPINQNQLNQDKSEAKTWKTPAQISRLNFSPDGEYLLMASWDNSLKLWKIADRSPTTQTIPAHQAQITDLDFSHDGQKIATVSWDRTIKLWNRQGQVLQTLQQSAATKNYAVWNIQFSPDDQILATVIWDGRVILWDSAGAELGIIPGEGRLKTSFSPDGHSLITGGKYNSFELWSIEGAKLQNFVGHTAPVTVVQFSVDGRYLISASGDHTVKLWTRQGKLLKTILGHQAEVTSISFSPNDQLIVTASADGIIKLWRVNGKQLQSWSAHNGSVNDVAFSPDGQRLASASNDTTVKLWNLQGQEQAKIEQSTSPVTSLAFSSDGKLLAMGGFDNKLILVDTQNLETGSLQSSLVTACDWLADYLQTNPQAEPADRLFCQRISRSK
jgi:WD40 repeat protein